MGKRHKKGDTSTPEWILLLSIHLTLQQLLLLERRDRETGRDRSCPEGETEGDRGETEGDRGETEGDRGETEGDRGETEGDSKYTCHRNVQICSESTARKVSPNKNQSSSKPQPSAILLLLLLLLLRLLGKAAYPPAAPRL